MATNLKTNISFDDYASNMAVKYLFNQDQDNL